MSDLPQVGAEAILIHDKYDKDIDAAIAKADEFDTRLNDLGGTVTATVDVDSSALTDLEDTQVDVGINVDDSELPFDEIPEETNTDVNLIETEDAKTAAADLHFMANLKRVETVIEIAGNVLDVVEKIGSFVATPFLDVEEAVARINAQTGGTGIEDLGQFIRDIQAADLGTGIDQITSVVIAAKQLGAPIDEATRASLTFTKVFDDQDPVTVMTSLKSLANQFGVSITEASDLMTVFFQQGGNKGGDALNTVNQYAQSWADMGLSFSEALSLVQSLMAGGVDTSGDAAKMVQTFDDQLTAAAADPASAQAKMLKMMGIDNPKDRGEAIGAETIDGFVAAFDNLPADQQDLASSLFFGKGGKKFTSAIGEATTQSDMFSDVKDAAVAAATEIDDSLRGAIDDFILELNTKMAEVLSSDAIDLPGKIEALKKGLQDALTVLAEGGTIGEALEVALNIPGLGETIDTALINIQRVFGQFVLTLLDIVATIQDPLGINNNDDATRAQMKTMATQQLPFDIKVANPDELPAIFGQAARRGVTDLGGALNTALTELVNEGDFSKVQAILGKVLSDPTVTPEAKKILTDKYTKMIADATEAMKPPPQTDGWWQTLKPPSNVLEDTLTKGTTTGASRGDGWWTNFTPPTEVATAVTDTSTAIDTATSDVTTSVDTMATSIGTSLDTVQTNLEATGASAELLDGVIARTLTDNTVTASFDAVLASADANFPGVIDWFDQTAAEAARFDSLVGIHLRSVTQQLSDVNFLALQTIANVTSAQALGGGGTVNNNQTTTINVTNNNSNGAQTANSQYQLSQSLGGR